MKTKLFASTSTVLTLVGELESPIKKRFANIAADARNAAATAIRAQITEGSEDSEILLDADIAPLAISVLDSMAQSVVPEPETFGIYNTETVVDTVFTPVSEKRGSVVTFQNVFDARFAVLLDFLITTDSHTIFSIWAYDAYDAIAADMRPKVRDDENASAMFKMHMRAAMEHLRGLEQIVKREKPYTGHTDAEIRYHYEDSYRAILGNLSAAQTETVTVDNPYEHGHQVQQTMLESLQRVLFENAARAIAFRHIQNGRIDASWDDLELPAEETGNDG